MSNTVVVHPDDGDVPVIVKGATLTGFLANVAPPGSGPKLEDDAVSILRNSDVRDRATSLVIGRVQSGKTMSYEALLSLARDNSYALLVVVSGISNALLEQGVDRLRTDLVSAQQNGWNFFVNPDRSGSHEQVLAGVLADWRDQSTPAELRRTAVALVLKNVDRLAGLIALLNRFDWTGVPVLIIDDEADQASMNNLAKKNEMSATYRLLLELRDCFPIHAYIQYTATPQAPLLIQISDVLSPQYVQVLQPGLGYTGGETFFLEHPDLIKIIPPHDIIDEAAIPPDAPESLLDAMRVFYLGLAYNLSNGESGEPRSMLVHPSRGTGLQREFVSWVRASSRRWLDVLENADQEPEDYADFEAEFEGARAELLATIPNFPQLADIANYLKYAIRKTQIVEMNTRGGQSVPSVDWAESQGFILIGGQALDRGFTVRGLTVTYMPRGLGVGNADTVQQRARFFGYKADYLNLCRVYLESGVESAFRDYVDHEIDMHRRLTDFAATGKPLSEWTRAFLLDTSLRPTRQAVLNSTFIRGKLADVWHSDGRPALEPARVIANRDALADLLSDLTFEVFPGHAERTAAQTHEFTVTSLRRAIEVIESQELEDPVASMERTGLLLQLTAALDENSSLEATIVRMRPNAIESRSIARDGVTLKNLFQGRNRRTARFDEGEQYPGDMEIVDVLRVTVQIHRVNVLGAGDPIGDVPVLATWVPADVGAGWYVQSS